MESVEITNQKETRDGWVFEVRVGSGENATEHEVTVEREYAGKLSAAAASRAAAAELVRASFQFLLAREPKESILPRFNLRDISRYFPEYEQEISKNI